jgi:hypothetical protein
MLAQHPAPVILPNYRFDWLPKEDLAYIESHYFPLADDFLVLGTVLPPGGGAWSCLQGGRYQVFPGNQGTAPASSQVDGHAYTAPCVLALASGPHDISTQAPVRILVAWVGPNLPGLPQLPPGSHVDLFVNWY